MIKTNTPFFDPLGTAERVGFCNPFDRDDLLADLQESWTPRRRLPSLVDAATRDEIAGTVVELQDVTLHPEARPHGQNVAVVVEDTHTAITH